MNELCVERENFPSSAMNYNLALPFYENSIENSQALALFVGETRFSSPRWFSIEE
jgi:hypothetical protein